MANLEHTALNSSQVHEPKHITGATTSDAGKIITPDNVTNNISELRYLQLNELATDGYRSKSTGWAYYVDNAYTSGSPLSISSGVRTKITINGLGAGTDITNLADGDTNYWDTSTNKLLLGTGGPVAGDVFEITLRFKTAATGGTPYFDLQADVAGAVVAEKTESLTKSSAINSFDETTTLFVSSAVATSGAEIYFTPSANLDFYDFTILITKLHQAG